MTTATPRRAPAADIEPELHALCAEWYADPLGFVLGAYPWPIQGEPGPNTWQTEELMWIGEAVADRGYDGVHSVAPIRKAYSTGNGVGKTALFAWVVDWIMSTRAHCRGTVTANTADQLEKKTWAAVREWTKRCATAHWFEINNNIMYRKGFRESWFVAPLSCAPENADAYQGQHAKGSTSFYVFDEASGIPETIWDAAEGGLTDEPIMLVGGNPLRSEGRFYAKCFGPARDLWHARIVDAREVSIANHAVIAEWLAEHGEDGDFVRVHVRGLAPKASSLQFIGNELVWDAQRRPDAVVLPEEPLIAGVDFSGGGHAWNVVRFRRGFDARSIPPVRVSGEATRTDRAPFLAVLAGILGETRPERKVAAMFCDAAYGAPYVERLHRMGFDNVYEVNSGSTDTPDRLLGKPVTETLTENLRAFMWAKGKEWLKRGGVLPAKDTKIEADLVAPGFHLNKSDRLVLEAKESMAQRGLGPVDDADAHHFTFAAPVAPVAVAATRPYVPKSPWS